MDSNGLGAAGTSGAGEVFQALAASLIRANYENDVLSSLTYLTNNTVETDITIAELDSRLPFGELRFQLRLSEEPEEAKFRIPQGKFPVVCLVPTAIHREETIITEIRFSSGLTIKVADAIALQDKAALLVKGYQLIHPRDYNSYYRAKADETTENNLESPAGILICINT